MLHVARVRPKAAPGVSSTFRYRKTPGALRLPGLRRLRRQRPQYDFACMQMPEDRDPRFAQAIFPGAAIMLAVMGLNFLGDGLIDALDPKYRKQLT